MQILVLTYIVTNKLFKNVCGSDMPEVLAETHQTKRYYLVK